MSITDPLVMGLHQIDAQISEFKLLITTFRNTSWIPSHQTFMQLEDIRQNVELLLQSWKEDNEMSNYFGSNRNNFESLTNFSKICPWKDIFYNATYFLSSFVLILCTVRFFKKGCDKRLFTLH